MYQQALDIYENIKAYVESSKLPDTFVVNTVTFQVFLKIDLIFPFL